MCVLAIMPMSAAFFNLHDPAHDRGRAKWPSRDLNALLLLDFISGGLFLPRELLPGGGPGRRLRFGSTPNLDVAPVSPTRDRTLDARLQILENLVDARAASTSWVTIIKNAGPRHDPDCVLAVFIWMSS